jgi:predicted TIM-barrel fold metal-dependent hydrolase
MDRRKWMTLGAMALATGRAQAEPRPQAPRPRQSPAGGGIPIKQYEPKSMLHLPQTKVARSHFPVVDFHTHVTMTSDAAGKIRFDMDPANCLSVMDRKNIRTMVNLTGGYGEGLREAVRKLAMAHPGRFVVFTEPVWNKASDPVYSKFQGDQIKDAHKAGAKGLKILKTLGLFLREHGSNQLVRIDDPRFDPMWEAAGALHMPVAIHISDPEAFFLPIDRFNQRWEELHAHPDWSFHGKDFPNNRELQEARRNVMRRHHNMSVDIAARICELGRQPRMSRKFFDKYQDRILFGTDASPDPGTPQQIFGEPLYEIYYRFLETEDEYFDYAPAPVPHRAVGGSGASGCRNRSCAKFMGENAMRLIDLPS